MTWREAASLRSSRLVNPRTGSGRNQAWWPMNSTAGEQWEFDGVSEDGKQAFIFGVYRDPDYSFLGTGNLRVHAEFPKENGSR